MRQERHTVVLKGERERKREMCWFVVLTSLCYSAESICLSDLKACKLTPAFLNTFINVEKYLDYEQRDLVTMPREEVEGAGTEWDRYATEQYEILLAEEVCENDSRWGGRELWLVLSAFHSTPSRDFLYRLC